MLSGSPDQARCFSKQILKTSANKTNPGAPPPRARGAYPNPNHQLPMTKLNNVPAPRGYYPRHRSHDRHRLPSLRQRRLLSGTCSATLIRPPRPPKLELEVENALHRRLDRCLFHAGLWPASTGSAVSGVHWSFRLDVAGCGSVCRDCYFGTGV